LRGRLQLNSAQGHEADVARAETSSDYISMATDPDLTVATHGAIQEMVDFLVDREKTDRTMPTSREHRRKRRGDQLVDKPNFGVHVKLPESISRVDEYRVSFFSVTRKSDHLLDGAVGGHGQIRVRGHADIVTRGLSPRPRQLHVLCALSVAAARARMSRSPSDRLTISLRGVSVADLEQCPARRTPVCTSVLQRRAPGCPGCPRGARADCCSRARRSGAGATPMLPKKGRSEMTMPGANSAVMAFLSSGQNGIRRVRSQFSGRKPLQPL